MYFLRRRDNDVIQPWEQVTSSRFGLARKAEEGKSQPGYLVVSPYSLWSKGKRSVSFRLKLDKKTDGDVVIIDVASHKSSQIHNRMIVSSDMFEKQGTWQDFTIDFELKDELTWDVEFRVEYLGKGSISYETTSIQVDYNIEIIDLLPYLSNMKTHATLFDAHPNAQTHEIISEVLYQIIKRGKNRFALSTQEKNLVN